MASIPSILEAVDLVKHFASRGGEPVRAVNGVSFAIEPGVCFGLLGPNGAGKTTTVEILEGILAPTSGQVLFRGAPTDRGMRERVGIQFQETALPDFMRAREVLDLFASFYPRRTDLAELIRLCRLEEFLDRDVHDLSGGQRQRVLLALALVNDPELVFLDEPTTGLDPQARRNFWELVRSVQARGTTVILTTHYMEEAYELCDEIAIMDRGRIIARGAPDALLREHFDATAIELPMEDFRAARSPLPLAVNDRGTLGEIRTHDVGGSLKALWEAGVPLNRMTVRPATLEDLFIELTGKDLRG